MSYKLTGPARKKATADSAKLAAQITGLSTQYDELDKQKAGYNSLRENYMRQAGGGDDDTDATAVAKAQAGTLPASGGKGGGSPITVVTPGGPVVFTDPKKADAFKKAHNLK